MSLNITGALDMPIAETYFLASKARSKLSREASRHDHNLRVLVSHANLLDNLMDSLAEKRRAGIQSTIAATKASNKHATFAELPKPDRSSAVASSVAAYEEDDETYYSSSSDDEYEYYGEEEEDDDDEEEYHFQEVTPKKVFRSLPTVDEDPIDETDAPTLSYSSEEEESDGESEELASVASAKRPLKSGKPAKVEEFPRPAELGMSESLVLVEA